MPKKDFLKSCPEIIKLLKINLDNLTDEQYQYIYSRTSVLLNQLGRVCKAHHINFITPKLDKLVHYGFSPNKLHTINSLGRKRDRSKKSLIDYNEQKQIANEQFKNLKIDDTGLDNLYLNS